MKDENTNRMKVNQDSPRASGEEGRLLAGQVKLLYDHASVEMIATLVNSIILAFVLWQVSSHVALSLWLVFILLVTMGRYVLVRRHKHASGAHLDAGRWGNWFTIGVALSGIIWGSAGLFLFPVVSLAHQVFIAFVMGGMVAGAVGVYSVLSRTFLAYTLPTMLPINVQFFMQGTDVHFAMGLMILLFTILMVGTSRRMHATTASSLRLGFENTGLIERLAAEKEHIEGLNDELTSEIAQRRQAQEALEKSHQEVEQRVAERTTELEIANKLLEKEVEDRKRAEEALLDSELRYRELVENLNEVIYSVDEQGVITYVSPVVELVIGYEPSKVIGRPFSEFIYSEDLPWVLQKFQKVLSGEMEPSEYRLIAASGETRWFRSSSRPIFEGDRAIGVRGVMTDITERKLAEEALRESEERYRSLVENIDLGVTLIDSDHNILMTNAAQGKMFRKSHDLFVGKKCFREFEKRESICPHCPGVRAMETGRPEEVETQGVRDDGSRLDGRIHAFPISGKDGRATGFIEIVEDITDRKELEAQLQQAHKMEAIGTLAGGIAHDFNNVLGIIVGNTELAMDEVPEWYTAQENLKEVRKACLRAKDMVRQILAFSRQTEIERRPLKLSTIVKESLKLMRSSIPTTIDIRQHVSLESGTVSADATQISQVLINLCTNAVHAIAEEGGLLEIGLEDLELDENAVGQYHDLKPGNYVRLTVSDTGHGIEQEIMGRIFDPYFTTREVDQGTGMGLAVVHGIVKNHGGVITVDSEPGRGATFRVLLPTVESEVKPETETPEAIPGGSERILFVDDEQPLVNLARRMLERLGYGVVTKMSSLEAMEAFRAQPDKFDLVITDMTMPHMTGDRLAKEMIRIRPDIPVILCTGHSDRIDELRAKAMGIRAFLMKPFLKRDIATTVREVLDESEELTD